jgi:polar amino acid transport system permease protein
MDIKSVDKRRIRRTGPSHYISWLVLVVLLSGLAYTLATNENYRWSVVAEYFTARSILNGIVITILLTVVSMVLGVLLGLVIAVMRSSSLLPISTLARLYITFFRGTPVLVQLIFWFNLAALYPKLSVGIPFTGISYPVDVNALMGPLTAAIIGLSLNQAAYMSEIIRGGFLAVGKGQLEAAEAL